MKQKLTDKQAFYLELVCDFIRRNNQAPFVSEVASIAGVSKYTALYHLKRLRAKGYIDISGERRGITIKE